MKDAADSTAGQRRAALALHALGVRDRHWLMRRLSYNHRKQMRALLRELASLGIPRDREVIRAVLVQPRSEVKSPLGASEVDDSALCDQLKREPAAVRMRLLDLLETPVRERVIARCPDLLTLPAAGCTASPWSPALAQEARRVWLDLARSSQMTP